MTDTAYRGRFAPSPTGPLHFGSLATALASFLDARHHNGHWLIRIEDLDPLRESPEAADRILSSLQAHGLTPDEPVSFQSQRHPAYRQAVAELLDAGYAYRCPCSRKALQQHHGRHPAACRKGEVEAGERPLAIRFALDDEHCRWHDRLSGPQEQRVRAEVDDPVLVRKEGFYAYQLAVVVDDIAQGITHVVRGSDLLEMTAPQLQLYRALSARTPSWLHVPVILNTQGQKLSKQNHAPALDDRHPERNLLDALEALGQNPPASLEQRGVPALLDWGVANWQPHTLPRHPHRDPRLHRIT